MCAVVLFKYRFFYLLKKFLFEKINFFLLLKWIKFLININVNVLYVARFALYFWFKWEETACWWCSCCDAKSDAILDLAYSIRIAPRSDDSRYLPCNACIAEPALCTSLNSTKATGIWLLLPLLFMILLVLIVPWHCTNCCCWTIGLECILSREKPGKLRDFLSIIRFFWGCKFSIQFFLFQKN